MIIGGIDIIIQCPCSPASATALAKSYFKHVWPNAVFRDGEKQGCTPYEFFVMESPEIDAICDDYVGTERCWNKMLHFMADSEVTLVADSQSHFVEKVISDLRRLFANNSEF